MCTFYIDDAIDYKTKIRWSSVINAYSLSSADPNEANVWLISSLPDVRITARQISEFPFPAGVRVVLLLQAPSIAWCGLKEVDKFVSKDGLTVISIEPVSGIVQAVVEALKALEATSPSRKPVPTDVSKVEILAKTGLSLDVNDRSVWKDLAHYRGIDENRFADRVLARAQLKQPWALWELITLATSDAARIRHDGGQRLSEPRYVLSREANLANLGRDARGRRVLDACEDIAQILKVPAPIGKVLIIDDNESDSFRVRRQALASYYDTSIEVINPLKSLENPSIDDDTLFWFFLRYNSFSSPFRDRNLENVLNFFRKMVMATNVILVDQLFKLNGDEPPRFYGADLIRGLKRWMCDDPEICSGIPPEILALSQSDDPHIIQRALRSGAKDYVLKSRFIGLPAAIQRVSHGISDNGRSLHRSFDNLYRLPNETIGLLQKAIIPPIPFHKPGLDPAAFKLMERWNGLLSRLPKADLHVHAGSVMSQEFLVLASLAMLSRLADQTDFIISLQSIIKLLQVIVSPTREVVLSCQDGAFGSVDEREPKKPIQVTLPALTVAEQPDWLISRAQSVRGALQSALGQSQLDGGMLRAHLHADLGIRDYLSVAGARAKLESAHPVKLVLYAVRHCSSWADSSLAFEEVSPTWSDEDILRICILVLAAARTEASVCAPSCIEMLSPFRPSPSLPNGYVEELIKTARLLFDKDGALSIKAFRNRGWRFPEENIQWMVSLPTDPGTPISALAIAFESNPLGYSIATGTRAKNLNEYLVGCEFAGALHLQHPYLLHIYARQAIAAWVRTGVVYVELRTSPDGYSSQIFDYMAVVQCLQVAFSEGQTEILGLYQSATANDGREADFCPRIFKDNWPANFLGGTFTADAAWEQCRPWCADRPNGGHLPCKVSLIFVGKRHKPLRELILEAASAALTRHARFSSSPDAASFVKESFSTCRVVGFDLAGPEDGYPPEKYADEFGRLSRLHIPITIHAGENAPTQFIEDAILELGAKRIGHGLSVVEDKALMARVRDDRICIELCPVGNFQTSRFHDPTDSSSYRRPYPLAKLLDAGVMVSINTDNPIVSNTTMVRELYQASWALSEQRIPNARDGLSLWDCLRLVRMSLVSSFLDLEERKHLLEVVGQHLSDIFCSKEQVEDLYQLCNP